MLRITITDYNNKPKEEAIKSLLDSQYVVCYKGEDKRTIFCKDKSELFATLSADIEAEVVVLELYDGSVNENTVVFLTRDFKEDN